MLDSFRDLQRLAGGFQASKMFLTANDLGLFTRIGSERCSVEELANDLKVDRRALELVLNALTALGLLQKENGLFRNHPVVHRYLGEPEHYRGSIFRHIHHCWEAWNQLPDVLRTGRPDFVAENNALGENNEWTRDFIQGMNDVTRELAPQVVPQLDLEDVAVLMDVGGGPGTYVAAFREAWPDLERIRLFDLPEALEIGRRNLAKWGVDDKVEFCPGNFHNDSLPSGCDAIWLSQVLHSQDEAGCRSLLRRSFDALNSGGRLLIHEFLLDDDKTAPVTAAIFAVHMLVMTQGGRAYSGREIGAWMEEVGFTGVEVKKVSDDTAVVCGRKP